MIAALGDTVTVDAYIYHRSGVDNTVSIVSGVDYVVMDDPEEGDAMCALTVKSEDELRPSYAALLYTATLDLSSREAAESHPQIKELKSIEHQ